MKSAGVQVRFLDQTHTHIGASTDKRIGNRVDKLSRDTKVAYFDLSLGVEQNIGRFDV